VSAKENANRFLFEELKWSRLKSRPAITKSGIFQSGRKGVHALPSMVPSGEFQLEYRQVIHIGFDLTIPRESKTTDKSGPHVTLGGCTSREISDADPSPHLPRKKTGVAVSHAQAHACYDSDVATLGQYIAHQYAPLGPLPGCRIHGRRTRPRIRERSGEISLHWARLATLWIYSSVPDRSGGGLCVWITPADCGIVSAAAG
jgi:hypothetical protein